MPEWLLVIYDGVCSYAATLKMEALFPSEAVNPKAALALHKIAEH
jgi:hypothetical protein